MSAVPWGDIETLFLDAGNTLVSIDFPWLAAELCVRGVACDTAALARAEAAARPALSRWLGERSTEADEAFPTHLRGVLSALPGVRRRGAEDSPRSSTSCSP
jgi:hypothetical protein